MFRVISDFNEEFQYVDYKCIETEYGKCPPWIEESTVATCNTYNEAFSIMEKLKSESGATYALVLDNTKANSFFVCPLGQAYECERNFSGYEIIHKGTYLEMSKIEDEWNNRNIIPFGL